MLPCLIGAYYTKNSGGAAARRIRSPLRRLVKLREKAGRATTKPPRMVPRKVPRRLRCGRNQTAAVPTHAQRQAYTVKTYTEGSDPFDPLLLTYHRIYINAAVGERSQTAAQTAAELAEIDRGAGATEDGERALVRGINAADGEADEVPAAVE